jgi:ABC-type Zn uptake system ZnuABC Zn-binding protein ZnuA
MMALYDRLRTTANRLLATYAQGTVEIGRPAKTDGDDEWDAPTVTTVWTPINAVVRGVSASMVDGNQVLMTDLVVTATIDDYAPQPSDLMRIDGKDVAVIRQEKIPGAGIIVAWRFIVRA